MGKGGINRLKQICQRCGVEFNTAESVLKTKQKYCVKCSFKYTLPTQAELARRAGRTINDTVQTETDKADLEGVSYGVHMARKVEK